MGYYVYADYSNYYEGDKIDVSHISVPIRPHAICEWNGSAWTFPLAAAQGFQKRKAASDMQSDLLSILYSYYSGTMEMLFMGLAMIEATAFEDDTGRSAASVSFLNGYKTQRALASLQDAADEVQADYAAAMTYMGRALAQKKTLFETIDAETDGQTCLTHNWVPL